MSTKTCRTAARAYAARKVEILASIDFLRSTLDADPGRIDWGHVGDLGRIDNLLVEAARSVPQRRPTEDHKA